MTSAGRRSRQSDRRRQRRPSRQRSSRGTGCASAAVLWREDRKSTRLNSSHVSISYAVFCLKKKKKTNLQHLATTNYLSFIHHTTYVAAAPTASPTHSADCFNTFLSHSLCCLNSYNVLLTSA